MPITHVKAFLLVAVFQKRNAAVCQYAVAIHQKQLDARRAPLNFCFIHRTQFLSHLKKFDARESPVVANA